MTRQDELVEQLARFYDEVGTEAPSTPPGFSRVGGRRRRWLRPVLASVALIVAVVALIVAVRTVREEANRLKIGPSPSASTSNTPTSTPTPTPSPSLAPSGTSESDPALRAALAVAAARGYRDCNSSFYRGPSMLRVLVCFHPGASAGPQLAFFFWGSTYLGTDTSNPSAHITPLWGNGDTVALNYTLYRPDDPNCCPTGGGAIVRFHWNGTRLQALDPIPTDGIDAPLSRR